MLSYNKIPYYKYSYWHNWKSILLSVVAYFRNDKQLIEVVYADQSGRAV
jgi:hypothetical protein